MENLFENCFEINDSHDGHRERLRQRMLLQGVDSFKNHELLEYLLFHVIPRQDVNELAHALVYHFGNLKNIFSADMQSLLQVEGMGETAAEWICTLGRLSAAWGILRVHDPVIIDNYGKMYAYARKAAPEIKKPCCMQLLMDDHGRLIYRHILGDIPCRDEAHSRFLLHEALSDIFAMNVHSAALIIFVGKRVSYPSNFDRKFARDYARLLNLASVTPVDIVILGSTGAVSMRRLNMVPENLKYLKKNSLREKYISSLRPAKLKPAHYRFHTDRRMNYECTESL